MHCIAPMKASEGSPEADMSLEALLPPDMTRLGEDIGVQKAKMDAPTTLTLAILAGAFIALGGMFATTALAGTGNAPWGPVRVLVGVVFSLGLILVIVGGAELFTGNNMIVMAWASHKVSTARLLRNWLVVYAGNFVGALATALVMFLSRQFTFGNGTVGAAALATANAKVNLDFVQ